MAFLVPPVTHVLLVHNMNQTQDANITVKVLPLALSNAGLSDYCVQQRSSLDPDQSQNLINWSLTIIRLLFHKIRFKFVNFIYILVTNKQTQLHVIKC